jgi:hypothetical protein
MAEISLARDKKEEYMRLSILALLLIVFPGASLCQTASQTEPERAVRIILQQLAQGGYDGPAVGPVNRLGDAASVALTQIFGGQKPSSKEIENILMVIRMAFAAPQIVEVELDRQPRSTLFVLQYLEFLPVDAKLKGKIRETRRFVIEQAKKASKSQ